MFKTKLQKKIACVKKKKDPRLHEYVNPTNNDVVPPPSQKRTFFSSLQFSTDPLVSAVRYR